MKEKTVFPSVGIVFVLILIGLGFTSCSKENDESREMIITVASIMKIPVGDFGFDPYWVKMGDNEEWTGWQGAEGFEHEEGHEYRLRVREEKYPDWELVMDRSMYQYIFVRSSFGSGKRIGGNSGSGYCCPGGF